MPTMVCPGVKTRTLRYRKVASQSKVDESLFGGYESEVSTSRNGRRVSKKLPPCHSQGSHDDIVMREDEYARIKDRNRNVQHMKRLPFIRCWQNIGKPVSQIAAFLYFNKKLAISPPPSKKRGHWKLEEQPDFAERLAAAQERRRRILANECERRKKELRKLGKLDESNSIRETALLAQYEQRDEVKQINQMILYSKVNTIRDAQIEQKKQIKEAESAVEKQLDLLMDIDRLRGLQQEEEREQARLRMMKEEANLIRSQIAQREAKRELELAERERERQILLKQMEKLRVEEERTKAEKEKIKRMLIQEVNNHNANSSKEKEKRLAEKLQEDLKIAEYQREKAQREKELEQKRKEVRAAKEKELASLYAKHERALDKAAELDAIRARRAMDERERRERLKEEQEKQRQAKINAELATARQQQHFEKLQTLAQMAVAEREEFDRVARVQRETEAAERKKREEEALKRQKIAEELQQQIREHQEKREKRVQEKSEEAIKLRQQQEEDRQQIENIRMRKLKELEESGVSTKYMVQLRKASFR